MARSTVTKSNAPGSYPSAGVTVAFTASDTTNGNQFRMTGDDLLIVRAVGSSGTFTISSVANSLGRTRDITTEAISSGEYKVLGTFKQISGWRQSDGFLYFTGSATAVEFAVVKVPRP
jgi:hypothetical protein